MVECRARVERMENTLRTTVQWITCHGEMSGPELKRMENMLRATVHWITCHGGMSGRS